MNPGTNSDINLMNRLFVPFTWSKENDVYAFTRALYV